MQDLTQDQIKGLGNRQKRLMNNLCPVHKTQLTRWFDPKIPWCVECSCIWDRWHSHGDNTPTKGPFTKADYDRKFRQDNKAEAGV